MPVPVRIALKNKRAYGAIFSFEGGGKGYFASQNSPSRLPQKKISPRSGVNLVLGFQNDNCCACPTKKAGKLPAFFVGQA